MTQVFLSHSSVDAEFALRLAADLRSAGVPVWKAPESIIEGERWVQAVTRGVMTSSHMLILMSPASVESEWVNFEFEMALSLAMCGQMKILPLEYQACEPPASWSVFQYFKGLDSEYDKTLLRLVKHINREQPENPPEPTAPGTTIHVHIGGDTGDVTIAGGNITYRDQPAEPPRSVTIEPAPAPQIEAQEPEKPATLDVLDILPPPFEWCAIPGGQVTLEGYVEIFDVQPFYMAKYPTTLEQFQVFVDDPEGFKNPAWWRGLSADANHQKTSVKQKFTYEKNLPRDSVSWYDAVAFCRWLTVKVFRSPSPSIPLPQGEGSRADSSWPLDGEERYREIASQVMRDAARELRKNQTDAEAVLWACLRDRQLSGLKFRRQHPVANTRYVVDFFCYESSLIVELDGPVHNAQVEGDAIRQQELESLGCRVIRFRNEEVFNNLETTLAAILRSASPRPEGEGSGVRAQIRLPTEWEWQWAAQGPDGRLYPWGDDFEQRWCNTYESRLGKTTPVDFFPAGAGPYGVVDMSGNVWEWCLNEYHNPKQLNPTPDAPRVVRGGSWHSKANSARAASRDGKLPHSHGSVNGFRIVCG